MSLLCSLKRKPEPLLDPTPQIEAGGVKKVYQAESCASESWESNPRYQKLETIGKGYSAVVFKAYDTVRKCCVAIKTVVNAGQNDVKEAAARESLMLRRLAKNQTPHQIPPLQMEQLINLLKGMLKYEDRWTPDTLLLSPLFREDICFHLPADLPTEGKILIHRISDVFSGGLAPLKAVLTFDLESPVTRTCYHLPKDSLNHYVIFDNLPGPQGIPEIHINLQDGDTLDLKQHITQR